VGTVRTTAAGMLDAGLRWGKDRVSGSSLTAGVTLVAYDYLLRGVHPRPAIPWVTLAVSQQLHPIMLRYSFMARGRSYDEEPKGFLYVGLEAAIAW
jgi:hypothetical protein